MNRSTAEMDVSRELRTLRHRQADLVARRDHRRGTTIMQGPVRAVQVFAETTIPTTVPRYFACHPLVTGGVEGEGQALVATPDTAQVLYVAVLGPRVPVAGDRLIARLVGSRWVADLGKSSAPTTAFHIQFNVTSTCQGVRPGATVTVVKAGVTRTCTTDASGICTIDVPTIGSFTYTVALSGYATASGSGNVSAVGTLPISVSMGTPTGFICACSGTGQTCAGFPIPATLHANDGIGSFDIVSGAIAHAPAIWDACITRTGSGKDATCTTAQSVSPVLYANFTCGSTTDFSLTIGAIAHCPGGGTGPFFLVPNSSCQAVTSPGVGAPATPSSCSPFTWSGSVSIPPDNPLFTIYGGTAQFTVTS